LTSIPKTSRELRELSRLYILFELQGPDFANANANANHLTLITLAHDIQKKGCARKIELDEIIKQITRK
jgi:hypothetical protein